MASLDSFFLKITQIGLQSSQPILLITKNTQELENAVEKIRFFAPELPILEFPDWEILIYDRLSPSRTLITKRLATLHQLQQSSVKIVITTLHAYLQKIVPPEYIASNVFHCKKHDEFNTDGLQERLINTGYQRVSNIGVPGEFSIRGSTVDIFPLNHPIPFRIDINIDKIEHLWYFDPDTQKTTKSCEKIELIPPREFSLSQESISQFKAAWCHQFGELSVKSPVYKQLSTSSYPAGIEHYLPLFFHKTNCLLDYLPENTRWISSFSLDSDTLNLWKQFQERHNQFNADTAWPILSVEQLYQTPEECVQGLNHFEKIEEAELERLQLFPISKVLDSIEYSEGFDSKKLLNQLCTNASNKGIKIVFCATRASNYDPLIRLLNTMQYFPVRTNHWNEIFQSEHLLQILIGPLQAGVWLQHHSILVVPDTLLLQSWPTNVDSKKETDQMGVATKQSLLLDELVKLALHTPVVHSDYGIGQYAGLELVNLGAHQEEFIILNYAKGTKLYVPVIDSYKISSYSGQENPTLNALHTEQWKKTKQKALKQVRDTAAELLDLYAQRAQQRGYAFSPPGQDYTQFVQDFKFQATPDQAKAIDEVIRDLCHTKPMDRLVCGDVGFGKTEVAMRAAFLAVQSNKQVAVLVPTTLLVEQHYRNFQDRFSEWPIRIDWISRFRSASEIKKIQEVLFQGKIDIIIGTHALLSKKTHFKDLGLVIIDEEHHFGVQQKEKLKMLRKNVDILTLTATPIPRTLQSALSGLKEISIIATPPAGRLPIKTFVLSRRANLIREAMLREFLRGGQIYFVHNRISTLESVARELKNLIPEAAIVIAHGQLEELELEERMSHFYQKNYNVLLCTSIIETGLDIPTVNTLIVDRADQFGLAQLHQLRGRVGRAQHQAYAYFLIPEEDNVTKQASQRLQALASLNYIGAGFNLASQDLDIRGAGNILGEQQSGAIQGIGLTLYMELLNKTIEAQQQGGTTTNDLEAPESTTVLDFQISTFFPEDYVTDVAKRLQYYKKIAHSQNRSVLDTLRRNIIDQHGLLPEPAQNLFEITALKLDAKKLAIHKVEVNALGGWLELRSAAFSDAYTVLQWIQNHPLQFKLKNVLDQKITRLQFTWQNPLEAPQRIQGVQQIFEQLHSLMKA